MNTKINQRTLLRYILMAFLFYTTVFFALSGLGNVAAYHEGWLMIHTTLTMKGLPAHAGAHWRAIESPLLSHIIFVLIYLSEFTISFCAFIATIKLWIARNANEEIFQQAKSAAFITIGLTISLTFFGFLCIACQWFRMWMSTGYNGQSVFFQLTILYSVILVVTLKIQ